MLGVLVIACGSTTGAEGDASTDAPADGAKKDSGDPQLPTDGAVDGADAGWPTGSCPASMPANGAACASVGLLCEYDDSYMPSCAKRCGANGTWGDAKGLPACPAQPSGGNAADCPATFPKGGACMLGGHCQYAEGWCGCIKYCGGPPPPGPLEPYWQCEPAPQGCPSTRPRFGDPCTAAPDAGSCLYELCCANVDMVCANGIWQGTYNLTPCP